jgi:hypothetical protein
MTASASSPAHPAAGERKSHGRWPPAGPPITEAAISADGRTVVFSTEAYNMGVDDGLGDHVFAWHRQQGSTTVIAAAASCVWSADVPANGRTALFTATMRRLVPRDIRDVRQSDAFVAEPLR